MIYIGISKLEFLTRLKLGFIFSHDKLCSILQNLKKLEIVNLDLRSKIIHFYSDEYPGSLFCLE